MINELIDPSLDDNEIASLIETHPRISRMVEEYNRHVTREGDQPPLRYVDTVAELKARIAILPIEERIRVLACFVGVREKNMENFKQRKQEELKHRIINAMLVLSVLIIIVWLATWAHSHITGKEIPSDSILGQVFNFFTEVAKLVFGIGGLW